MALLSVKHPIRTVELPISSTTKGFWDFTSGSLLDLGPAKNNLTGNPIFSTDSGVLAFTQVPDSTIDKLDAGTSIIGTFSYFIHWAIVKRQDGSLLRTLGRGKDGFGLGWSIGTSLTNSAFSTNIVLDGAGWSAVVTTPAPLDDWIFVGTILQQANGVEPSHLSSYIGKIRTRTGLTGRMGLRTSTIGTSIGVGVQQAQSIGEGSAIALAGIEDASGMTEAVAQARLFAIHDALMPAFNRPQKRNIWIASEEVGTPLTSNTSSTPNSTAALYISTPLSGVSISTALSNDGLLVTLPLVSNRISIATSAAILSSIAASAINSIRSNTSNSVSNLVIGLNNQSNKASLGTYNTNLNILVPLNSTSIANASYSAITSYYTPPVVSLNVGSINASYINKLAINAGMVAVGLASTTSIRNNTAYSVSNIEVTISNQANKAALSTYSTALNVLLNIGSNISANSTSSAINNISIPLVSSVSNNAYYSTDLVGIFPGHFSSNRRNTATSAAVLGISIPLLTNVSNTATSNSIMSRLGDRDMTAVGINTANSISSLKLEIILSTSTVNNAIASANLGNGLLGLLNLVIVANVTTQMIEATVSVNSINATVQGL